MRLSDFTDLDRAVGLFGKLIFALFVLLIVGSLTEEILARLTCLQALVFLALCLCMSPAAYFIRKRRRPSRPDRVRRGTERTPILPPREEEE
jgi:hypothetical protein